jgi:hypothetical protein
MGKDYAVHRADGDYALYRYEGEDTFTFKDKRTGHRYQFHECVENGFGGNVFLYHHPTVAPDDAGRTAGYKCGFLNKDSLPAWLIEEFESIHNTGAVTEATDPR